MAHPDRPLKDGRVSVYRHPALVRLGHWITAAAFLVMLTSGLQIFNAHPALYLGPNSTFDRPLMSMTARQGPDGALVGVTRLFGREAVTTGLFGVSAEDGAPAERAFPTWITLPPGRDLATARLWHLLFAWVLAVNGGAYVALALIGGRARRELIPTRDDLRGIGASVAEHLKLRFPAARRYNVLQKLSYAAVLFVLLPLMVATGMTLSPGLDAAFPWLPALFGGRQTARTIHFLAASGLSLFLVVHLVMVMLAGPMNEIRSMITGRYAVRGKAQG